VRRESRMAFTRRSPEIIPMLSPVIACRELLKALALLAALPRLLICKDTEAARDELDIDSLFYTRSCGHVHNNDNILAGAI
jgi:hypothetical protein